MFNIDLVKKILINPKSNHDHIEVTLSYKRIYMAMALSFKVNSRTKQIGHSEMRQLRIY